MLKAKMTLLDLSIPVDKIVPARLPDSIQVSFLLEANVKVDKRRAGSLSGAGIDSLVLQWIETVDWFEFTNGRWKFKGTDPDNRDLYAFNPNSNTFSFWNSMRYSSAVEESNTALTEAVRRVPQSEYATAAKHWIAEHGLEWTTIVALDTPALRYEPGAGSRGGAGPALVTSNSRRRVIHFNLGFKESFPRVTATLVQETMNGAATINKFLLPGISVTQANDETNLARWRQQFTAGNWTLTI